jgi:hypothetical protein
MHYALSMLLALSSTA